MKSTILPLLLLVFLLGCAGVQNIASSSVPGVRITKFYSDQEVLSPNERTDLTAQVTNEGGHRAQNVEATLFRLGEIELVDDEKKAYSFGELEPADPMSDTPAEKKEHVWSVRAPSDTFKREGYNLGVQLKYDYTSDGWADLVATTKEQAEVDASTTGRSGSSVGPIGVAVYAPPVLLYDDEKEEGKLATVRVDLQNMGAGHLSCSRGPDIPVNEGKEDERLDEKKVNRVCSLELRVPEIFLDVDKSTGAFWSSKELLRQPDGVEVPSGTLERFMWYCKPLPLKANTDAVDDAKVAELLEDPDLIAEYVWELKREGGDIVLTKDISDIDTGQYDVLELMRGKEKSFVCYFKIKTDAVGAEQVIPIRAEAKYTYATEAALMLQVKD